MQTNTPGNVSHSKNQQLEACWELRKGPHPPWVLMRSPGESYMTMFVKSKPQSNLMLTLSQQEALIQFKIQLNYTVNVGGLTMLIITVPEASIILVSVWVPKRNKTTVSFFQCISSTEENANIFLPRPVWPCCSHRLCQCLPILLCPFLCSANTGCHWLVQVSAGCLWRCLFPTIIQYKWNNKWLYRIVYRYF